MAVLGLLLAAIAALCNAFSSVLQRKANREEPADEPFGVGLVLRLLRSRVWLLGALAMIASFLLQASALSIATLSAVEPVLVVELPLTLIIGSRLLHHPLHNRDWITAAAMAAGLALFVAVIAPSGGDAASARLTPAVLATIATVAAIAATVLVGHFVFRRARAALFGAAAGSGFGLTASLMKIAVAHLRRDGVVVMFHTWELYGMVLAGIASVVLVQAALRAGTLIAAQPGITLLDPLISVLWGTVVLGESTRTGPILVLAGVGGLVIVIAVVLLTRSSASAYAEEPSPETSDAAARPART